MRSHVFPETAHPPAWREIGHRFSESKACLASFLAFESAEIIEGLKPANLVNIVNRNQPCGRNLYLLWLRWGEKLLADSGLSCKLLRRTSQSLLVMIYDHSVLDTLLGDRRVQAMLLKAGYPASQSVAAILERFRKTIREGGFPHEIGILLGYPLKDVAGFMGWIQTPFSCQGPWKIYGDPTVSLHLAERHRDCRKRMAWRVANTDNPLSCLRRTG